MVTFSPQVVTKSAFILQKYLFMLYL